MQAELLRLLEIAFVLRMLASPAPEALLKLVQALDMSVRHVASTAYLLHSLAYTCALWYCDVPQVL